MDELSERIKKQRDKRLQDIKDGKSFFGKIPNNIGELVFCDTTNDDIEPYTSKEKTRRTILGLLIPSCITALCFWASVGFGIFVAIIALIVIIVILRRTYLFKGTDMFVGAEGYAEYSFEDDRKNIVSEKVHRFDDLTDLIATGTEIRYGAIGFLGLFTISKGTYQGTSYSYAFFKKNGDRLDFIDGVEGEFNKDDAKDKVELMDEQYKFWTCIEQMWSRYKMDDYKRQVAAGNDTIGFTLVLNESFFPDYIKLGNMKIIVNDIEYNTDTMKNIGFSNGNLIIQHVNYTKKLFGLIQKGNQEVIPLNSLSNRMVFLELLGKIITIE